MKAGWLFLLILYAIEVRAENEAPYLRILTEHNPPGQYLTDEGKLAGVTVALIRQLQQRLNEPADIELLPWARAFAIARQDAHIALFETARTAEREHWFQWVGPLKYVQTAIYGRADRLGANPLDTGLNAGLIACEYRYSLHVDLLQHHGYVEGKNLVLTLNHGDCFQMLLRGRVDLVVLHDAVVAEREKQLQAQAGTGLYRLKQIREVELYLAFSLDVAPERIAAWQQALQQSYLDGSMRQLYQPVYSEYLIERLEQWARQE
ncbi:substrate-binding periplasmic protein [Alkalimonas amylolytica]|uniref:Polar amino acid transport system substrate-binding protein n=1 Tax=Alkalimonas amylolytica TaxID=152573 RepID=A0A1H3XRF1_ALKAM|nr:transporter substrate-binding domain-containing protein [Alkalimonas amylolytica]SEA02077.1 polar amino acid transport system substrate-binding protein [Alkalimonas amylolytica]